MTASFVAISNNEVQLTVDQPVAAGQQLDPGERTKIVRALTDVELDQELAQLINELCDQAPVTEVSCAAIVAEVRAVRQHVR